MNRTELKTLIKGALNKEAVPGINFADVNSTVVDSLMEAMGIDPSMNYKQMKKYLDYSIIEEVIDEILPEKLQDVMGSFVNVKQYGRDEEVKFTIKGIGKKRAMLGITEGARGGVYKARRLDDKNMFINTKVFTCGVYVTLEEILLGKYTLGELMDNILEGFEYIVYVEVVKALRSISSYAPAANRASAAGFVKADMDNVIRVVSAYGKPTIFCFESFAAGINNELGASVYPNIAQSEAEERRHATHVSVYKGTPVVVIPNYIFDEVSNGQWIFREADAFILPAEKPVWVALKGEGYFVETQHPTGSVEQNYHKIMGVGILLYNNLGIYTDTNLATIDQTANNLY